MLEVEEGPSRRVSRGRKRASHGHDEGKANTEQKGRCLRSSRLSREADWFGNSFLSNTRVTSPEKPASCSTPKAKRTRRISVEADTLNTSDALFADIDIDTITSQALSQSQIGKNVLSTENDKENKNLITGQDVKQLNKDQCLAAENVSSLQASTTESQSQYFVKKFGNYCPTQPVGRKEVIVENRHPSAQVKSDSSFSFSFIGNDTQIDEESCDKFDRSSLKEINVGPKDAILESNLITDTQIRTEAGSCKPRCTPYFKTADLSVSMIDSQDLPQAECLTQSQFCIPGATQSKEFAAVLDTTQLKDAEGFKYRCTPYKTKSKDLCTQTQTQCDLMAGTQYQSFLHDSYKDSQSQLPLTSYNKQSQICYGRKPPNFIRTRRFHVQDYVI